MRRAFLVALLACASLSSPAQEIRNPAQVDVAIFAINDLHGNLMPPAGGIIVRDAGDPAKRVNVAAGGVERMASLIKQLRAENKNSIFVGAGDLIGASPLLSGMFHDEPTVDALSLMGLEVSAVGNHEFDKGSAELKRMQNGGCHPKDGCQGPHKFTGAQFHYLAASTIDKKTGKTIFPPYYVKRFDSIPVAFIGLTLKDTPALVAPPATAELEFKDEAETVNALVPGLKAQGINAIVVLIHNGGIPEENSADYNGCPGLKGTITQIVPKLDKAIDVVISGHSHQAYNCIIDGRLVTSAHRYSTMVSEIHLTLDRKTRDVVAARAQNLLVRDTLAKDPDETKLIAAYEEKAAPIANRVVGRLEQPLLQTRNEAGESALGDVIADAELAAAKDEGAVIGLMNAGGVRSRLGDQPGGSVTHADVFAAQPFSENVVTLTLTGTQIRDLLEAQWTSRDGRTDALEISRGLSYSWDASRPPGGRVVEGSLILDGAPIRPEAEYRVALPDFLADGPGSFTAFQQGKERRPLMSDLDVLEAYLKANNPLPAPETNRIRRIN